MRLKGYLKGILIFSLLLFLGIFLPLPGTTTVAHAEEAREIKLNVNNQKLVKGKSFSIKVYNLAENQTVSFRSTSPTTASVNEKGVVSANQVGMATIVVTVTEGDSVVTMLTCKITIGPPAISVQFTKLQITLEVGESYTIKRIVQPLITTEDPQFSSYNKTIASVSAGGRVSAKTVGETYIFAQISNGNFAVCKVTVVPKGTFEAEEAEAAALAAETELSAETETSSDPEEKDSEEKEVITDPLLKDLQGMSFEAFLKKLNAVSKASESVLSSGNTSTN